MTKVLLSLTFQLAEIQTEIAVSALDNMAVMEQGHKGVLHALKVGVRGRENDAVKNFPKTGGMGLVQRKQVKLMC
jgi:hypothetical protein